MPWEKLSAKSSKRTDMPALSIQKNGRVAWNLGAQNALGDPEFVELLIDHEANRLGLKKTVKGDDNFIVRKNKNQKTWSISAQGALNSTGLVVDASYRRYGEVSDNVVYININEIERVNSKAEGSANVSEEQSAD